MKKTNRELERIVKGFDFKNVSAHITKMAIAGLVIKKSEGNIVRHRLSRRGKSILQFVRIIE